MQINIKPMTVNRAWQGRRYKTPEYKQYERDVLLLLPKIAIPDGELSLYIQAGFSSKNADIDNIAKPFIDILQKKYKFNDSRIFRLTLQKEIVPKGKEYIYFRIEDDV